MGAVEPREIATRISALLRAGLEQDPHLVALGPNVAALIVTFLDAAGPMIAAAAERDDLARQLAEEREQVRGLTRIFDYLVPMPAAQELLAIQFDLSTKPAFIDTSGRPVDGADMGGGDA